MLVVQRAPDVGTMFGMNPDAVWRGGRLGNGVRIGAPAGLVFPRFEGHLSAFGESRRKLTKEVPSAEDEATIPA